MTAELLLSTVLLAISSWTLLTVVGNGKQLARLQQQMDDLPCRRDSPKDCDFAD